MLDVTMLPATPPTTPFFIGCIPCIPPSINESYTIGRNPGNGKGIFMHSTAARRFLKSASIYLAHQDFSQLVDPSLFNAISKAKRRVPLHMTYTVYYPTLYARDASGGIKIVEDALFIHLKKIAVAGYAVAWNDSRNVDIDIKKRVDPARPRVEVSLSCAILEK